VDLGDLEIRVDFGRDLDELAFLPQAREERSQVPRRCAGERLLL
jgi:hypothetical protein